MSVYILHVCVFVCLIVLVLCMYVYLCLLCVCICSTVCLWVLVVVEATHCKLIWHKLLLTVNLCNCMVVISVNTIPSHLGKGWAPTRIYDRYKTHDVMSTVGYKLWT